MQYCLAPNCAVLVPRGRCLRHGGVIEQRPSSRTRGYDTTWARYSVIFRQQHPICGEQADGTYDKTSSICLQLGLTIAADVVDHKTPMSKGGSKWNPANHQSLCSRCNSAKGNRLQESP